MQRHGTLVLACALLGCSSAPPKPQTPGMPEAPGAPNAPQAPGLPDAPAQPTPDEVLQQMRKGGYRVSNQGGVLACEPAPVEIFVQADSKLNLNESGQPMPVEVRAFLMRDRETFDQLDFETLWKQGGKAIGKDLVASASLTVFPGRLKIYPLRSAPQVAYVALVAIFRRPASATWKYVVDIREQNRRCRNDDLHTIVHARLRGNWIGKPVD